MEIWILFVVLAVLAAALPALLRKRTPTYDYQATAALLSKGERAFADALEPCLPANTRLITKVRVADVITPANRREIAAFRRISQKHLDFVVLDRSWKVLAAIELNDKTHDQPARKARDELLRDAFQSAAVPLHFVRAQARYNVDELHALIGGDLAPAESVHVPVQPIEKARELSRAPRHGVNAL